MNQEFLVEAAESVSSEERSQLEKLAKRELGEAAHEANISNNKLLLAIGDAGIVGFLSYRPESGACEIDGLAVDEVFHRRGVGSALLEKLVEISEAEGADKIMVHSSDDGRDFYLDRGFRPLGDSPADLQRDV